MRATRHVLAGTTLVICSLIAHLAHSQLRGTSRTDLQRHDIDPGAREVIQARVDIPPGVTAPKHWHPGEEFVYVIEGTLEYQIEGAAPVRLKAGEVLFIPARAAHTAKNVGNVNAAELATYVVEKSKPLVVAAD